ncbi:MAG TPA: aldo/keto reductase [Caldimonas sp.]|nr:aldo/keto reductase [Caldimonas sp.]
MATMSRRGFSGLAGATLLGGAAPGPVAAFCAGASSAVALATASAAANAAAGNAAPDAAVLMRAIPGTGERLPAVGLGTAGVFDRDDASTRDAASAVLRALLEHGGKLVDTASSYGDAEQVLGTAMSAAGWRDRLFVATKVEALDDDELARSLARLKTARVDLLQLHNVRDADRSLARLREWKAKGRCRYVGITSTYHRDFAAVESVLRREKPDVVQIDYSLDDRIAEERILPAAADVHAAVLTALPFGRGRLFRAVRGKAIPEWAREFAGSWSHFFLKYLLGDERVTAVIPGTSNPAHMADNAGAMRGRLPDAGERRRMVSFIDAL